MAPHRKWIDRKMLKELCLAQCSNAEIAGALHISWDTLQRRYAEAINVWRSQGPMSARRRLFTLGMRDDPIIDKEGKVAGYKAASVPSLIFFLKNYGGMSDVVRESGKEQLGFGNVPISREFDQSRNAHKPN